MLVRQLLLLLTTTLKLGQGGSFDAYLVFVITIWWKAEFHGVLIKGYYQSEEEKEDSVLLLTLNQRISAIQCLVKGLFWAERRQHRITR